MKTVRLVALALVALLAPAVASAEVVHDDKLGFSFSVPEGFHDFSSAKQAGQTLYAYAQGSTGNPDFMVVAIEDMHGTIGQDHLTADKLPKDPEVTYELRRVFWKGFDIDVIVGRGEQGDGKITVLVAQVPLATPDAIQIKIMGASEREAQLDTILATLLASLDGKTNWLTAGERIEKRSYMLGVAVGAVVGLGLALWLLKRRRARRVGTA